MKPIHFALAALLTLFGCGGSEKKTVGYGESKESSERPLIAIDTAEDQRTFDPRLIELLEHPNPEVRRRLALALGRIGDQRAIGALEKLLNDREPSVVEATAFSAGLFGKSVSPRLIETLFDRLAKEKNDDSARAILISLGRIGTRETVPRIAVWTDSSRSRSVRSAALQAIGIAGYRGIEIDQCATAAMIAGISDPDDNVRLMSAFAMANARVGSFGTDKASDAAKKAGLGDSSVDVRIFSIKAMARHGWLDETSLSQALNDGDERVVSAAVHSLGSLEIDQRCKLAQIALVRVSDRLERDTSLLKDEFGHSARAALEAAVSCPPTNEIAKAAAEISEISDRRTVGKRTAGESLVECLARLVSGSGELALLACDPERPSVGKKLLIERIAAVKDRSQSDVNTVMEMMRDKDLGVAVKAVDTAAAFPPDTAGPGAVVDATEDSRMIVVTAALDGIAANFKSFRHEPEKGGTPSAHAGVIEAIDAAVERFSPFDHAHGPLIFAASALERLGDPRGIRILRKIAEDPRPEVRAAGVRGLRSLGGEERKDRLLPSKTVKAFSFEEKESWRKKEGADAEAVIRTTRGEIVVRLDGRTSPGTVADFAHLARTGYYSDTEIYRVVPSYAVEMGDDTATGYGDPGYAVRCELNSVPYERGAVGMSSSAKDAGGSRFFIALSRQPELDGAYTLFGRVVSGIEVADLIEEGDRIIDVEVSGE